MQSDDIAIEPKSASLPVINGGDGAFTAYFASPPMISVPMNIDLSVTRQARINYFGNLQEAVGNDPKLGITVVYDTDPVSAPEQFWQKAATGTTMGTADNTRTAGDAITITGGREINWLTNTVAVTTSLLSEHLNGFMEFASSDFLTSLPYRIQATQAVASLGATGSMDGGAGIKRFNMPIGKGIPIAGRTVVNTFFTQRDALAVGGIFVGGLGYIK